VLDDYRKLGFEDIIAKPFLVQELLAKVAAAVDRRRSGAAPAQ